MPFEKIIRRDKDYLLCSVPSHNAVGTELVERHLHGKIKSAGFQFPVPRQMPQNGFCFPRVPDKYLLKLAFVAKPGGIKAIGKMSGKPKIRLVIPASPDETKKYFILTNDRYFTKPFGVFVTPQEMEQHCRFCEESAEKTDSVLLMKGEKLAGMFSLIRREPPGVEPYLLLAWSCISPELTKTERLDAHYQISRWLAKKCMGAELRAAIHVFNVRSQKFHFKLGMRPVRVVAQLRPAGCRAARELL